MPHDPLDLPEQQITPPEIGRTECQGCQVYVPTETVVNCANPRCQKALCALCTFTCENCETPLCRHCATKPDIYGGGKGLCKRCQGDKELGVEDGD